LNLTFLALVDAPIAFASLGLFPRSPDCRTLAVVVGVPVRDKCPLTWENQLVEKCFCPGRKDTFIVKPVLQLSRVLRVVFDDDKSVPYAGLVIPFRLADRLGIRQAINQRVSGRDQRRRPNSGDKALNIVAMLLAGGDFLSDVNLLRSGATLARLGYRLYSRSRLAEWIGSFTNNDIAGLKDALTQATATAWRQGFGPDLSSNSELDPLIVDIDSTFTRTHGSTKAGTQQRNYKGDYGYHPLLAVEAATGQVISVRLRAGNTGDSTDATDFTDDTLKRIRQLTSDSTALCLRADSGFYTWGLLDTCRRHHSYFSVTVRQYKPIRHIIENIQNDQWQLVEKTDTEQTDITEVPYLIKGNTSDNRQPIPCRLIIRRTSSYADTGQQQPRLFDLHEYHAFVTNQPGNPVTLRQRHNHRAVIENTIRDLKYNLGLNHYPSASLTANSAWLQLNALTWNLAQHTIALLTNQPITLKTLRWRYLNTPGRITTGSRTHTLHYPTNWPWQHHINNALTTLTAA